MLFNSFAFIIFAAIFFVLYFNLRGRVRLAWVILASCFFYAWWDWRFLWLLLGSTLIAFYSGKMIGKSNSIREKKRWLWFCVITHFAALGFFKYLTFLLDSLRTMLHSLGYNMVYHSPHILLPVGISFFTFTALSYAIDVYRGKISPPENDLLVFSAYRCLFPQLVAGPILRGTHILPQLKTDHAFDWAQTGRGLEMIIWGYVLKLCLADNAALFVNPRFENPGLFTSFSLLLAVLAFALQIYGDFAGYSLIAIGLARIMGYDFGINFDKPYFAVSISDFWRRWHITLSNWFRDYVFLPSAYSFSRRLKAERYLGIRTEQWIYLSSTLLTMTLVGLWHGASWTFILWGFLHGIYLAGQRMLTRPLRALRRLLHCPKGVWAIGGTMCMFFLVCLAWIFFRAKNSETAFYILRSIFSWKATAHLSFGGMKFLLLRIALIVGIVFMVDILATQKRVVSLFDGRVYARVFFAAVGVLIILFTGSFASNSFIYFQF